MGPGASDARGPRCRQPDRQIVNKVCKHTKNNGEQGLLCCCHGPCSSSSSKYHHQANSRVNRFQCPVSWCIDRNFSHVTYITRAYTHASRLGWAKVGRSCRCSMPVYMYVWCDLGSRCSMRCQGMRVNVCPAAPSMLAPCKESKEHSIGYWPRQSR